MKEVLGSLPEVMAAYSNYNLLIPTATDVQISPFYKYHVEIVPVNISDNSGDVYRVGNAKTGNYDARGKEIQVETYALSKPLLNRMALAAGISFNIDKTYANRIDRVTYRGQAEGVIKRSDGSMRREADQKVICLEDEEEKYQSDFMNKASKGITDEKHAKDAAEIFSGKWIDAVDKWGRKCKGYLIDEEDRERYIEHYVKKNMTNLKKNWAEKAVTGAKLRVIKSLLGIQNSYTKTELQKSFAIPSVIFSPDYSDPQVKQIMLAQAMNSVNNMFGMPQITVRNVGFETENNSFDTPDLDNPAYVSDIPDDDYSQDYSMTSSEPCTEPEPQEERVEPEENRAVDFQCSRCGTIINERVYEYSINKFGEPLCIKCQKGGNRR